MVREDTYTDEGRLLKRQSKMYEKDGTLYRLDTESYTYDQRGNLVEQLNEYHYVNNKYHYVNNNTVGKTKHTSAYDARNQLVEEVIYGYKAREDEFFPNITEKMEYDNQGRVSHYTTITSNEWGDGKSHDSYIEYNEQNGQVVRETRRGDGVDGRWGVDITSRAYDAYGNLVREDREADDTYSGSTNYYYDLATKAEYVQGVDWYDKPGMTLLRIGLLCDACGHKYRVTRITSVNASGDIEGLEGSNTAGSDIRFYYTSLPVVARPQPVVAENAAPKPTQQNVSRDRQAKQKKNTGNKLVGTVRDAAGPLFGATVCEVDQQGRIVKSTITNADGEFTLNMQDTKHKIRIAYIGLETIDVDYSKKKLNVMMQPATGLQIIPLDPVMKRRVAPDTTKWRAIPLKAK